MQIGEVMTRAVTSVPPDMPAVRAARILLSEKIGALPVIDTGGRVIGVIAEADLVRRMSLHETEPLKGLLAVLLGRISAADYVAANNWTVREIMSQPPVLIGDDQSLEEALAVMARHRIKHLPVVRGGHLIGMLSRRDLLRAAVALAETDGEPVAQMAGR